MVMISNITFQEGLGLGDDVDLEPEMLFFTKQLHILFIENE